MKCKNIHRIGIPEGEEEQGIENLFEKVMMENFRTFMREKFTQIQEATKRATIKRATIKRVTIKRNTKKPTTRHIVIKMEGQIRSLPDKRASKNTPLPN